MSLTSNVPCRGFSAERKPPYVVLSITPTPPPLPPPPPNPQLVPLKPRSRSQQWTSSKAFDVDGLDKFLVRSQSVKVPAGVHSNPTQPPPRPLSRPKPLEKNKPFPQTTSSSPSGPAINSAVPSTSSQTSNLRQDVFRISFYIFHSSLLLVSYLAWTSFHILLLPVFCVSYCIRQIGLLFAQHRRISLIETLSSLSLHYLHGEDAGRNTVVVVYLGSPGIKIADLKRLLVQRIFSADLSTNADRRPSATRGMRRWFSERLQQTVVPLQTGYAWQRCTSINLDEHVVPAHLVGQNRSDCGRRLSSRKRPPEDEGMVEFEKDPVEMLIGQLATVELPLNRPLWQVHLVEDYHDNKDALTVRQRESPYSSTAWKDNDMSASWHNSRPSRAPSDALSLTFPDQTKCLKQASPVLSVCSSVSSARANTVSRFGMSPTPTGSLIIFRVHSAITDDTQSLVEFLIILLSEGTFEETQGKLVTSPGPSPSEMEQDGQDNKGPSTCPIYKVPISDSSLEWQEHSEKLPLTRTPHGAANIRNFYAWLQEVHSMLGEVLRALLFGPFFMLHHLMMVPADLGLLPSVVRSPPSEFEVATAVAQRQIFRRIQLPLNKFLHVQKVIRVSFSEIAISLLSGALRAYQQTAGLKAPRDLHIRTSTPTPNFEMYCERLVKINRNRDIVRNETDDQDLDHREAVAALNEIANGPPSQCIFALMLLPLSEEGMIPRLWRVHQRVLTLQRAALCVTLAWTRDLLHLLLPHWLAVLADNVLLGGASKCSVTFAEVSLEGNGAEVPSTSTTGKRSKCVNRAHRSLRSGVPGRNSRRMDIFQALRLLNRPNSSQSSAVSETNPLNDRNLDLLYLSGGVPIVRIEAWLAYHHEASSFSVLSSSDAIPQSENVLMCRDLAMVTCVYGSHLTVGLSASCQMDGTPGIDFILNNMLKQLNHLYKLLDSRFPAKPMIYAPRRRFRLAPGSSPSNARMGIIYSSPGTLHRVQTAPSPNSLQFPPSTLTTPHGPDVVIGRELMEDKGDRFLKPNFFQLNSSLRRSSQQRSKRCPSADASSETCDTDESAGIVKIVPILKAPSLTQTIQGYKSQAKRCRTDESDDSGESKRPLKHAHSGSNQRRLVLAKKVKKRPAKPPPPKLRKSQVRFVTEKD